MKLYLASRFEEAARLRRIRDELLIPRGFTVTSRWLNLAQRADVKAGDWNTDQRRRQAAYIDLYDIDQAHAVVLDTTFDPTGYTTYGAFWEAGYVCGVGGKRMIAIGDNGSVFLTLPYATRVADWDAALLLLEELREAHK